jgi:hypothetical protein
MSIGVRLLMQRERNVEKSMERQERWLSRAITGVFDD